MLNKDQYNQEEYNNYYRQETEGAEIAGGSDEESGVMGKIIILLLLLALLVAGYFGYQAFNNSDNDEIDTSLQVTAESSLPQSVQELQENETTPKQDISVGNPTTSAVKITEETETKQVAEIPQVKTVQISPNKTSQEEAVQNAVSSQVSKQEGKMSPEEIAAVVAAVMQQMNQQQETESPAKPTVEKDDAKLMNSLSETEVDSVTSDLIKELESIDLNENTEVNTNQKQVDVYNKVDVQNSSGSDALSQLSDQIDVLTSEKVQKDQAANYTSSLQREVSTRKNEMRIIVVKKGDTLGRIAKRAYGNVMDYKKIYKANPHVTRPDRIYVGQKLRIPN
jgi:nucleoid-associated protein YgaU